MRKHGFFINQLALNPFMFMRAEDFHTHYRHLFQPDKGSGGKKWRYGGWWRNIHVTTEHDGCVNVHIDSANPNKSALMNLPHGVLDFIPWVTLMVLSLGKAGGDPSLGEMWRMLRFRHRIFHRSITELTKT